MLNSKQRLGKIGEKLAVKYLKKNSYTILDTNYRCQLGEIDIIARDQATLVFIEVKTRTSDTYGSPAAAVTLKKQRQVSRVAECYLAENKLFDRGARFDVISVLKQGSNYSIELIRDAFELCE